MSKKALTAAQSQPKTSHLISGYFYESLNPASSCGEPEDKRDPLKKEGTIFKRLGYRSQAQPPLKRWVHRRARVFRAALQCAPACYLRRSWGVAE